MSEEKKGAEVMSDEAISGRVKSLEGRNKLLLVLLAVSLLAAIGSGAFGFMQTSKLSHQIASLQDGVAKAEANREEAVDGIARPTKEPGVVHPLGNFVVNLMDPGNVRYVNCRIEVELEDEAVVKEIDGRTAQFKDAVISLLGSQTYEDLVGVEGKTKLREELLVRFNRLLSSGQVARVYLTEFVIQ